MITITLDIRVDFTARYFNGGNRVVYIPMCAQLSDRLAKVLSRGKLHILKEMELEE